MSSYLPRLSKRSKSKDSTSAPTTPRSPEPQPVSPKTTEVAAPSNKPTLEQSPTPAAAKESTYAVKIQSFFRGNQVRKTATKTPSGAPKAKAGATEDKQGGSEQASPSTERASTVYDDAARVLQRGVRSVKSSKKSGSGSERRKTVQAKDVPKLALDSSVSAVSDAAASVSSLVTKSYGGVKQYIKKGALTRIQKLVEKNMISLWENKYKITSVTGDPRMPFFLRVAIHEVADAFWLNLTEELVRAFDKLMEEKAEELADHGSPNYLSPDVSPRSPRTPRGPWGASAPPSPPPSPPDFGLVSGATSLGRAASGGAASVAGGAASVASGALDGARQAVSNPKGSVLKASGAVARGTIGAASAVGTVGGRAVGQVLAYTPRLGSDPRIHGSDGPLSPPSVDRKPEDMHGKVPIWWQAWSLLKYLHLYLRRDFIMADITVDVYGASNLLNADNFEDVSDPWCKVTMGRVQRRTKTIANSLDPQWNERFVLHERLRDIINKPLCLQIFDEDLAGDELLGDTALDSLGSILGTIAAASSGGSVTRRFDLDLSTQGQIAFDVTVSGVSVPSWATVLPLMFGFYLDLGKALLHDIPLTVMRIVQALLTLPSQASALATGATHVDMVVTIHKAEDLVNADASEGAVLGGGGLSDPYVYGAIGRREIHTATIQDSLNPEWGETFELYDMLQHDLLETAPAFEVFDEDFVTSDDSLGAAAIDREAFAAFLASAPHAEPVEFDLALSTQGTISVSLQITRKQPPKAREVWIEAFRPVLRNIRSFILYNRIPFDRGTYSKFRDWRGILVLLIASSTDVLVRGTFFTAYLLSVMVELEEYQVTRFILALKGFQFISGGIALLDMVYAFWDCTVLSEDGAGCVTSGPGLSRNVLHTIFLLAYLQLLLNFAVLLLPYAGSFVAKAGVVNYDRQKRLLREASFVIAKQEAARAAELDAHKAAAGDVEGSYKPLPAEQATSLFDESVPLLTRARRAWLVLMYPMRSNRQSESRNRLFALVHYDKYAAVVCLAIFALMAFSAGAYEERLAATREHATRCSHRGLCDPVRGWAVSRWWWILWYFAFGNGFASWRVQISFSIVKALFSLSAAPFFPLSISVINQLFTHADATAYTSDGRLTLIDTTGLSAFCVWLRADILDATRFQHELSVDFPPAEVAKVRAALEDGERFLEKQWAHPVGNVKKRCLKKKAALQKVLREVITPDLASDALYTACFPNEVLAERLRRRLRQDRERANRAKSASPPS